MMRRLALIVGLCAVSVPAAAVEPIRVESPGGIVAWLVEDRSVPVISLEFALPGGAAYDPPGKEGLAEMAAGLLDEGAGELGSEAFQRALEDIAASVTFSAGRDRFHGTLRTLSERRDRAFELLALALSTPRFDDEPVARVRDRTLVRLRREAQNPRTVASRVWFRSAFPDHPYGRPPSGTPDSVAAIARDDLAGFVRDRLVREGLVIGVVGDIGAEELAGRLDSLFGRLPAAGARAELPRIELPADGAIQVVRRPIPQSVVTFGHIGLARDDPDWYAGFVMNYVLGGGGFASRLNEEVREKRGLAYGIGTGLSPLEYAPLLMGGTATQNARLAETLAIIRAEWRRMAEDGVSRDELADAKTYLNGSFPLQLDSTGRIASLLVAMQIHDLGIDHVQRRPALIDAVSEDDVRRVARRVLDAARLRFVVVGDPVGLDGAVEGE